MLTAQSAFMDFSVKIHPNEETKKIFKRYQGASRVVYNLGIDICKQVGAERGYDYTALSYKALERKFNELKKTEKYSWLNDFNLDSLRGQLRSLARANSYYKQGINGMPKYKSKKISTIKTFYVRADRLKIFEDRIIISGSDAMPIEPIPCDHPDDRIIGRGQKKTGTGKHKIKNFDELDYRQYYNAKIKFDGRDYYLTFSMRFNCELGILPNSCNYGILNDEWWKKESIGPVGIDLNTGTKGDNWIVDSLGNRIAKPDCSETMEKIKKLQRKRSRQRRVNDARYLEEMERLNPNEEHNAFNRPLTKREEKTNARIKELYEHITNQKLHIINEYASVLVKLKPDAVVMEDIKVKNMLIHDYSKIGKQAAANFNNNILSSMFFKIRTIVQHKMEDNSIPFFTVNKQFPSSQRCSNCGSIHPVNRNRYYRCPVCGLVIDRDDNAAQNLAQMGYYKLQSYYEKFVHFPDENQGRVVTSFVTFG